jgi:hypothetical protein
MFIFLHDQNPNYIRYEMGRSQKCETTLYKVCSITVLTYNAGTWALTTTKAELKQRI